jgi:hypothetical protein
MKKPMKVIDAEGRQETAQRMSEQRTANLGEQYPAHCRTGGLDSSSGSCAIPWKA